MKKRDIEPGRDYMVKQVVFASRSDYVRATVLSLYRKERKGGRHDWVAEISLDGKVWMVPLWKIARRADD